MIHPDGMIIRALTLMASGLTPTETAAELRINRKSVSSWLSDQRRGWLAVDPNGKLIRGLQKTAVPPLKKRAALRRIKMGEHPARIAESLNIRVRTVMSWNDQHRRGEILIDDDGGFVPRGWVPRSIADLPKTIIPPDDPRDTVGKLCNDPWPMESALHKRPPSLKRTWRVPEPDSRYIFKDIPVPASGGYANRYMRVTLPRLKCLEDAPHDGP